jgi:hypothetical protein
MAQAKRSLSNWKQLGEFAAKLNHFHKRHYEKIALAIQDARRLIRCDGIEQMECVVNCLADVFAADNGEFKRDRFKRACEPGANVRART